MRHNCLGKQAHLCEALWTPKGQICRFRRIRQKDIYLTKGGLHCYEIAKEKSAEVIVPIETSRKC